MYLRFSAALAATLLCASTAPVWAEDTERCGPDMICASTPATVMAAMEKAGLKPELTKDGQGDPMIKSPEGVYSFSVFFYGCTKNVSCDSLRFETSFAKEPENTPELANKWNRAKRFSQLYVAENGLLTIAYDVSTQGGLNAKNFADVLDWWDVELRALSEFFDEEFNLAEAASAKS